ncbi:MULTISPECIES: iron-hydroxamate ABC transporter substrate-binding protein [unclassified Niallia]|uniref:iron-hydroxamate ABC transporter substrate-binding protein n=1 Tax=unclassified Niallia TaxID=2837522 RepID=UPI001EDB299E|nr:MULTISPECIES: iron-hydroxamate ABC transporter substrate-binding protein [unclassified Niallia]MCM3031020.1 iron-hydroxamate ABC transporter substrate-binding protein [Niallia sp. MER 6]UPO90439.1 iron-hydroxamate ABC transporter substrate-binding protein [Niallia sp. Man26]
MSKKLIPFILLLVLIISACGNKTTGTSGEETKKEEDSTITYESENGPIEVPADPQRVVALTNAGYVLKLGVNLVGVDSWSMTNPRYADELKDVEVVSEENIEKIAELQPDLIIAASTTKNIDKLGKIAPTVTYTYNKVDYLTQHLEIGKLLNKEKEAQAWIDDFKARAKAAGEEIKAKIGEDATVTVLESYDKSMYILGDSWGRGTEILYQAMGLKMPEKVKEMTEKEGYYTLSSEVLPEYVGDYLVISKYNDQDNSYQETDVYKNIPAVKNNHVLEANAYEFIFNDPISLDYQLDFFKENFLK